MRYVLDRGVVLFRLPEYSAAVGYTQDQVLTMDVAVHQERGGGDGRLRVSGTAQLVDEESMTHAEPVLDEHWPEGVATHAVALVPARVELVREV